jgi:hypothetical protein
MHCRVETTNPLVFRCLWTDKEHSTYITGITGTAKFESTFPLWLFLSFSFDKPKLGAKHQLLHIRSLSLSLSYRIPTHQFLRMSYSTLKQQQITNSLGFHCTPEPGRNTTQRRRVYTFRNAFFAVFHKLLAFSCAYISLWTTY